MPEKEIKLVQYECSKCGHKWIPRRGKKPKVCPVCKRMDWDQPKNSKK